jgi:hypothetical protein
MKATKTNKMNWTSHNELNAEPIEARIRRLHRHNAILGGVITFMCVTLVALFFTTLVIASA